METIEFKDIKYVMAVENAGSFSRAAEKEKPSGSITLSEWLSPPG